ncbi:MAG TPA: T9SS type A sorting domain-containing protein [Candidatus Kapabacteria bacterium]
MRSFYILILTLFALRVSASWSIIEDRKVSSFDMLTTRLGLIATNDASRVLGKWEKGTLLGVFIPSGEVNSIVIHDKNVAYASIKGDGIYQSSNGWTSWTKILDAVYSRVITVHDEQIFISRGVDLWYMSGGSFLKSSGIPTSDSVRDVAIVSAQTSYALGQNTLYRTNNSGKDWSVVIDTVRTGQSLYYDTAHKILYIGAKLPLRSLDNGQTFSTITSIFFFSTSGAIFGTKDCSGTFYIGPDSMEHLEMYRSTSQGRYVQEVGSAIFSSYRYVKCVILDRGSTFFWLDRSGILSVSRDGCDGTIPDSISNYVLFRADSAINNSICSGSSPTKFNLYVRYDLCTGVLLDSLIEDTPNTAFTFSFSSKVVSDTEIAIGATFRAKHVGIDSIRLRLAYHSPLSGLRESKEIVIYAIGISDDAVLLLPEKSVSYGSIKVGQTKKDTLYIVNVGCDTLRIDSLRSSFPALFHIDEKTYPIDILPSDNVAFGIEFIPKSEGAFLESAALWTNLGKTFITLTGTGYKDPIVSVADANVLVYSLYPNPTRGVLHIISPAQSDFTILNVLGNVVLSGNLFAGENTLDLLQLPNGIYTIITINSIRNVIVNK